MSFTSELKGVVDEAGAFQQSSGLWRPLWLLLHRFHRTFPHTFAAFDAEAIVYYRKAVGIL